MMLADDMKRMEYLPGNYYNLHPGSHVGQGAETGIRLIAEMLNEIVTPEQSTIVLLETMAGKGSEVGRSFEELKAILDQLDLPEKFGVCMDSCHVSDGGYDIIHHLDALLDEFDRHAKIGEGFLGLDTFTSIINHPRLKDLPFILETPNELDGYAKEIDLLRNQYRG